MIDKIKTLEERAGELEPGLEKRIELTAKTFRYAQEFLDNLPDKKAYVKSDEKGKAVLEEPFSDQPVSLDQLLSLFDSEVIETGLNPASGSHMGYIPGGGIYYSSLGDYLAAVTNRYAGVFFSSPGAVRMENMCIRWMCKLVGYPKQAAGNLTSGGSIANMIALATARDSAGLHARDFHKCVIYTTRQVHHSAIKAIRFTGLADAIIREIAMDEHYRMRPEELDEQIQADKEAGLIPFVIFSSAGTTDLGAVDPMRDLAEISEDRGIWYHVDAAYGGFFLLTEPGKKVMSGIENADSVVIDPHKGLFLPYGTGALLVKDGEKLFESQHLKANYMQDTFQGNEEFSPADLSPELSKHYRGLRMWLPLKLYGVEPFRAALEEKLLLAQYFYNEIQKLEGIEVGPEPQLSVMFFRYVPPEGDANDFNAQLVREIHNDGRVFLSSTNIGDIFYIRLAVLGFRTHLKQVDQALEVVREMIDVVKEKF